MSDLVARAQSFFDGCQASWNTNSAEAMASHYAEDGTLIDPFGGRAFGRDAVRASFAALFDGPMRGSSSRFVIERARKVEDAHVFVDGEQSVTLGNGALFVAHVTALLRRNGEGFLLADVRPHVVAPSPG